MICQGLVLISRISLFKIALTTSSRGNKTLRIFLSAVYLGLVHMVNLVLMKPNTEQRHFLSKLAFFYFFFVHENLDTVFHQFPTTSRYVRDAPLLVESPKLTIAGRQASRFVERHRLPVISMRFEVGCYLGTAPAGK